ncbi:MAG: BolA family transcriptional regulator [Burkholderiales bacterium]|nr:BolA family transcriptional regulator [Burkholderiales bacterium]
MTASLADLVRERLVPLAATHLDIHDDSAAHAGHAGVVEAGGGGHFEVLVVAAIFEGKSRVARHRLVYDRVRDLMPHRIHALAITAHTPDEFERNFAG